MKKFFIFIKLIISAALIYWVARKIDFSHFRDAWSKIDYWYLAFAYILLFVSVLANSLKWWKLLQVQKVKTSYMRVTSHYLVGYLFNNFITGVGEVKRMYDLSKESGNPHGVVASVVMERWTGVISQVTMALLALGWAYKEIPQLHNILLICGVLFLILLAVFLLLGKISHIPFIDRFKKIHEWLDTFREAHSEYIKQPGSLATAFLLSLVAPIMLIFIHWLLILGIGYQASLWSFVLFIPIISVFSQLPVTINGIGVQELLFVHLFAIAGIPAETSFTVSILSHLLKIGVGLVGGIIYLVREEKTKENTQEDNG